MAVSGGPNIIDNGLIYYLDAANPQSFVSGSSIISNLLNATNTGSLTGSAVYVNEFNGGIRTGVGTNTAIGINAPISSAFNTHEVWFRGTRAGGSDYGYILHNNANGDFVSNAFITMMFENTTEPVLSAYYNGNTGGATTVRDNMRTLITGSIDSVYQFVLVLSGSMQMNYVNGILQKSSSVSNINGANYSTSSSIGGFFGLNTRRVSGSFYSLKVYNRALNGDEILQNFNTNRSRFRV